MEIVAHVNAVVNSEVSTLSESASFAGEGGRNE